MTKVMIRRWDLWKVVTLINVINAFMREVFKELPCPFQYIEGTARR
jgi:hypothetical protein